MVWASIAGEIHTCPELVASPKLRRRSHEDRPVGSEPPPLRWRDVSTISTIYIKVDSMFSTTATSQASGREE